MMLKSSQYATVFNFQMPNCSPGLLVVSFLECLHRGGFSAADVLGRATVSDSSAPLFIIYFASFFTADAFIC